MKHVLNIALMAVVILGSAMLEATNWGLRSAGYPGSDLGQVGAQPSAQTAGSGCCFFGFWLLFFAWQAALVGILFYGVLATP